MDAKADLWTVMAAIGVPLDALMLTQDAPGFYHPGRSATVRQGPRTVLGSFGELHPRVLAALDLTGPSWPSNLTSTRWATRSAGASPRPTCRRSSRSAATSLSWWTSAVAADAVLRAARGADRALIAGVSLFDVYQGDTLPDGKKSLAIEVVFQPRERTLTDTEIEAASQKVIAAVAKATAQRCADRERSVAAKATRSDAQRLDGSADPAGR